jgi:hypothetical protein
MEKPLYRSDRRAQNLVNSLINVRLPILRRLCGSFRGVNAHFFAIFATALKGDNAVNQGK